MTIAEKFENITALTSVLDSRRACGYFAGNDNYLSSHDDNETFKGTKNYDEARGLLADGWHEGASRVNAVMTERRAMSGTKSKFYNSVCGFAPNVQAYIVGAPASMINRKTIKTKSRVVSIVYNFCCGVEEKTQEIENAAAALFNVITGLEKSGVRVDLWLCVTTESKDKSADNCAVAVRVKTASQPFNLLKMVFPIVHPSMLRRIIFHYWETCGLSSSKKWGGFGYVIRDRRKNINLVKNSLRLPTDNYLSYYDIKGKTEKEIADIIN